MTVAAYKLTLLQKVLYNILKEYITSWYVPLICASLIVEVCRARTLVGCHQAISTTMLIKYNSIIFTQHTCKMQNGDRIYQFMNI